MAGMLPITVIVPTCHRNDLLAQCLDGLGPGKQALAASQYEVMVTDDGSRSSAEAMVRDAYSWVRWVTGPRRGPAANRNNGAKHARGEWLAFVDDDCRPQPQWLKAIVEAAQNPGVDMIEGKTLCPGAVDHPLVERVHNEAGGAFWSCNLAVRRSTFLALGGFDEDFTEAAMEDMEFAWRFKEAGRRAVFTPAALVIHPPRRITWKKFGWRAVKVQRWDLMYQHKIGAAAPVEAAVLRALWHVSKVSFLNLLRNTWHLLSQFDARFWRSRFINQGFRWMIFPWVLPCLCYWEMQIRAEWKARKTSAEPLGRGSHAARREPRPTRAARR